MDDKMLCEGIITIYSESTNDDGDIRYGKLLAIRELLERYIEPNMSGDLPDEMNILIKKISYEIASTRLEDK